MGLFHKLSACLCVCACRQVNQRDFVRRTRSSPDKPGSSEFRSGGELECLLKALYQEESGTGVAVIEYVGLSSPKPLSHPTTFPGRFIECLYETPQLPHSALELLSARSF